MAAAYAQVARGPTPQDGPTTTQAPPLPANRRAMLLGYAALMGMAIGAHGSCQWPPHQHMHTAAAVLLARGAAGMSPAPIPAQPLDPFSMSSRNLLAWLGAAVGRPLWLLLTFLGDAAGASLATLGADMGVAAASTGAPVSMAIASMLVGT